MATITIRTTSSKEAEKVLTKVYEADRQGGYTEEQKGFAGSVLTAFITENNSVIIQSGYYEESTLKQMFE